MNECSEDLSLTVDDAELVTDLEAKAPGQFTAPYEVEYHIIYSESYNVPVLYCNGYKHGELYSFNIVNCV